MIGLVVASLRRRPARALLTATGIAVGVAAVVALISLGDGLKQTAAGFIHLGKADLGLFQSGVSDPTASVLPTSMVARLEQQPGVARATPVQLITEAIPGHGAAIAFGLDPHGFDAQRLVVVRGRHALGAGQAMVGDQLAYTTTIDDHILHDPEVRQRVSVTSLEIRLGPLTGGGPWVKPIDVGSFESLAKNQEVGRCTYNPTLVQPAAPFKVTGVFHSGTTFQDSGAVIPLSAAQQLSGHANAATTIAVALDRGTKAGPAAKQLERIFPGTVAIADPGAAARADANSELISKAVLVIVVLALAIGGIAVTNTMVMAVMERERELALLSAVGWRHPAWRG